MHGYYVLPCSFRSYRYIHQMYRATHCTIYLGSSYLHPFTHFTRYLPTVPPRGGRLDQSGIPIILWFRSETRPFLSPQILSLSRSDLQM